MLHQQELPLEEIVNQHRIVRLQLTREQIDLLAEYAVKHGYNRKRSGKVDITEQNNMVKWAILSRMGFPNE